MKHRIAFFIFLGRFEDKKVEEYKGDNKKHAKSADGDTQNGSSPDQCGVVLPLASLVLTQHVFLVCSGKFQSLVGDLLVRVPKTPKADSQMGHDTIEVELGVVVLGP